MKPYARVFDYKEYHWDSDDWLYEKIAERSPLRLWDTVWDEVRIYVEFRVSSLVKWRIIEEMIQR